MKYQFISKYGSGYSQLVGIGERNIKGVFERKVHCPFINAIYETNDDDVAKALMRNKYFGLDFHLNVNKEKVQDKYGESDKLGSRLEKLRRQELISIAAKQQIPRNQVFKCTKQELINILLQKPERTEALLDDTNRDKDKDTVQHP